MEEQKLSRRLIRTIAMKMIFAVENSGMDKDTYWLNVLSYAKSSDKVEEEDENFLFLVEKVLRLGKESEHYEFLQQLYNFTLDHKTESEEILAKYTKNWDMERIAQLDRILMLMVVTEWLYFPEIPTRVTLNEYMEIAKEYGNPDESHKFINGILDKALKTLLEQEKIVKVGKGTLNNKKSTTTSTSKIL